MRDRERQTHRQREKQAPCWEPEAGLDPGTPGLSPGPKAGAKPLRHPGIPQLVCLTDECALYHCAILSMPTSACNIFYYPFTCNLSSLTLNLTLI